MLKKILIIGSVSIVVLGVVLYFTVYFFFFPNGHRLEVLIVNNTDVEISELYLTYRGLSTDIEVDEIDSGETYHKRISARENIDESSLDLYYYDDNNVLHSITVIGYFEGSGGGQSSIVTINSIDNEGVMDITIEIIRP